MVNMIKKLMSCTKIEPDIRNCSEGEIRSQHLSAARAHDILKWEPLFDFESGLRETISWYSEFLGEHR